MARAATASAARTLLLDLATARASQALRDVGVRAVLLKGPVVARWLYDSDELRHYRDVDVLVAASRTDDALRALERLGYRDVYDSATEREASGHARILRAPVGQATGRRASEGRTGNAVAIDLHHSFYGIDASDEDLWQALIDDAEEIRLFGVAVEVPGEPARALFVALHAAADRTAPAQSFADLDRALERLYDRVWQQAYSLATRLEAAPAFVDGLGMLPAGRELARRLNFEAKGKVPLRLLTSVMPPVFGGLERLMRASGTRARLRMLVRALVPTPAYMRIWTPLATRGRLGLALAYAWRPLWLLAKLPGAAIALARARRET